MIGSTATYCYLEYFYQSIHEIKIEGSGFPRDWLYILAQNKKEEAVTGLIRVSTYDSTENINEDYEFYITGDTNNGLNGLLPIWDSDYHKKVHLKLLSDNEKKQTWRISYTHTYQRIYFKYIASPEKVVPVSFYLKPIWVILIGHSLPYGLVFSIVIYAALFKAIPFVRNLKKK
ncbi:hypothetical protein ACFLQK_00465 [bacterium]